jgi:hypothetical protein
VDRVDGEHENGSGKVLSDSVQDDPVAAVVGAEAACEGLGDVAVLVEGVELGGGRLDVDAVEKAMVGVCEDTELAQGMHRVWVQSRCLNQPAAVAGGEALRFIFARPKRGGGEPEQRSLAGSGTEPGKGLGIGRGDAAVCLVDDDEPGGGEPAVMCLGALPFKLLDARHDDVRAVFSRDIVSAQEPRYGEPLGRSLGTPDTFPCGDGLLAQLVALRDPQHRPAVERVGTRTPNDGFHGCSGLSGARG